MSPAKTQVAAVEGWFTIDPAAPALLGTRCTTCGTYFFPRESRFCRNPACDGTELEEVPLSRRGKVWSFTDNRYQPPPPFMSPDPFEPYAIAAVELAEEKMVVLGQLAGGASVDDLRVGQDVELVLETLYETVQCPRRAAGRWSLRQGRGRSDPAAAAATGDPRRAAAPIVGVERQEEVERHLDHETPRDPEDLGTADRGSVPHSVGERRVEHDVPIAAYDGLVDGDGEERQRDPVGGVDPRDTSQRVRTQARRRAAGQVSDREEPVEQEAGRDEENRDAHVEVREIATAESLEPRAEENRVKTITASAAMPRMPSKHGNRAAARGARLPPACWARRTPRRGPDLGTQDDALHVGPVARQ